VVKVENIQRLKVLDWTDPVPLENAETWLQLLSLIADTTACTVPRHAFSPDVTPDAPIRLICLADAGQACGGAAIYGGVELSDGSWTCQLLYAKNHLMNDTGECGGSVWGCGGSG
jgi:Pao retrotransposon peptidase